MAPTKAVYLEIAIRRRSDTRHRSLRLRGKGRRSLEPEEVDSDDSASDDESDDEDDADGNRNGVQQLPPSPSTPSTPSTPTMATPDTPGTLTATTTPGTVATTLMPGTRTTATTPSTKRASTAPDTIAIARETTAVPMVTLTSTHLHVTTTIVVPLTSPSALGGRSTADLLIGGSQTLPTASTGASLSAQPTDTSGFELIVGSNPDGDSNNVTKGPPDAQDHAQDHAVSHALISVGSIGAFVAVCFLFFALRAWRKHKREQARSLRTAGADAHPSGDGDRTTFPRAWHGLQKRVADGMPFLSRRRGSQNWTKMDETKDAQQRSMSPGGQSVWPDSAAPRRMQDDAGETAVDGGLRDVFPRAPSQALLPTEPAEKVNVTEWRKTQDSTTSSLSSGFGDGVTVIKGPPPGQAASLPLPPLPLATAPQASAPANEFVWTRSSYRQRASGMTAFTEASDDGPHRFRSVASWVRQQAGRLPQLQAGGDVVAGNGLASRRVDTAAGFPGV